MNNLNQFPIKIAEAETKILNLERQVNIYKEQLSFMDGEIETAIRRSLALRDRYTDYAIAVNLLLKLEVKTA